MNTIKIFSALLLFLIIQFNGITQENVKLKKINEIMENKIAITIEPKNSDVLAFEEDGEMVFVATSIYIANPGGDAVAGSFGRVVSEFFDKYFTASILQGILRDLSTPEEFIQYFSQGAKSGGSAGVKAGRKYFSIKGVDLS